MFRCYVGAMSTKLVRGSKSFVHAASLEERFQIFFLSCTAPGVQLWFYLPSSLHYLSASPPRAIPEHMKPSQVGRDQGCVGPPRQERAEAMTNCGTLAHQVGGARGGNQGHTSPLQQVPP